VANGGWTRAAAATSSSSCTILASRQTRIVELHHALEADDHDSPALLVRPDGRLLALYAKHNAENLIYYRISELTPLRLERRGQLRALAVDSRHLCQSAAPVR
jgi:hypothetical protein